MIAAILLSVAVVGGWHLLNRYSMLMAVLDEVQVRMEGSTAALAGGIKELV